jgi:hypothetical protein
VKTSNLIYSETSLMLTPLCCAFTLLEVEAVDGVLGLHSLFAKTGGKDLHLSAVAFFEDRAVTSF